MTPKTVRELNNLIKLKDKCMIKNKKNETHIKLLYKKKCFN